MTGKSIESDPIDFDQHARENRPFHANFPSSFDKAGQATDPLNGRRADGPLTRGLDTDDVSNRHESPNFRRGVVYGKGGSINRGA